MSCKWAIPGKLDWQCGINRTLCYGALLFAQFDVKGVSSIQAEKSYWKSSGYSEIKLMLKH